VTERTIWLWHTSRSRRPTKRNAALQRKALNLSTIGCPFHAKQERLGQRIRASDSQPENVTETRPFRRIGFAAQILIEKGIKRLRFEGAEELLGQGATLSDATGREPLSGSRFLLSIARWVALPYRLLVRLLGRAPGA
jgi:hypothetical protein